MTFVCLFTYFLTKILLCRFGVPGVARVFPARLCKLPAFAPRLLSNGECRAFCARWAAAVPPRSRLRLCPWPQVPFLTTASRHARQATPMRSPLSLHNENVALTGSPAGVKLHPFPPPTPTDADDADEPPPPPPPANVTNEATADHQVEVQPGPSLAGIGCCPTE